MISFILLSWNPVLFNDAGFPIKSPVVYEITVNNKINEETYTTPDTFLKYKIPDKRLCYLFSVKAVGVDGKSEKVLLNNTGVKLQNNKLVACKVFKL